VIAAASLSASTPRLPLRDARLELDELADKLPGVQDPEIKALALERFIEGAPAFLTRVSKENERMRPRAVSLAMFAMTLPGGLVETVWQLNAQLSDLELIAPANFAARSAFADAIVECRNVRGALDAPALKIAGTNV
jgi:hypothetical protein